MLYFHKRRLVLLSTTKNGTSSLEATLGKRASIAARFPPALKHMPYSRFVDQLLPTIEATSDLKREDLEVVLTMREPVSWLRSWFRYRQRDETAPTRSTRNVTFEQFALEYMKPNPKPYAGVGTQMKMFGIGDQLGVDRIFPYENFDAFVEYLSERLDRKIKLPRTNVSASHPTELSDDTKAHLEEFLATNIAFHRLLNADGTVGPTHQEAFARYFAEHPME